MKKLREREYKEFIFGEAKNANDLHQRSENKRGRFFLVRLMHFNARQLSVQRGSLLSHTIIEWTGSWISRTWERNFATTNLPSTNSWWRICVWITHTQIHAYMCIKERSLTLQQNKKEFIKLCCSLVDALL